MGTKLIMYRGDEPTFFLEAKQADGSDMDISSGELFFTAKSSYRQSDDDAYIFKTIGDGIVVSSGPEGRFNVTVDTEDTSGMYAPALLVWDVQYVTSGGKPITLLDGTLLIKPDVTRSVTT